MDSTEGPRLRLTGRALSDASPQGRANQRPRATPFRPCHRGGHSRDHSCTLTSSPGFPGGPGGPRGPMGPYKGKQFKTWLKGEDTKSGDKALRL